MLWGEPGASGPIFFMKAGGTITVLQQRIRLAEGVDVGDMAGINRGRFRLANGVSSKHSY